MTTPEDTAPGSPESPRSLLRHELLASPNPDPNTRHKPTQAVQRVWVGLDPSVASFGYAALRTRDLGAPEVLEVGTWRTKPEKDKGKLASTKVRTELLACELVDLIQRVKPEVVVVEGIVLMPKNGMIAISLAGRIRGIVEGVAAAFSIPILEVSAQSVKHAVTGSRSAEKSEVAKRVLAWYPEARKRLGERPDDNATDALAIAHVGGNLHFRVDEAPPF